MQVTRMLGHKDLWIDAFCIIQNDETDKARELVKMGDIYVMLCSPFMLKAHRARNQAYLRDHVGLEVSATVVLGSCRQDTNQVPIVAT